MLAIANACQSGELEAELVCVISNKADAAGLAAAQKLGIKTQLIERKQFNDNSSYDGALHKALLALKPDWILLAGFMHILGEPLVSQWPTRILNIHPSLLPKYPGLNTHARALQAGDKTHGATVHLVTAELDAGPVIAQKFVNVKSDDTPVTLGERVLALEHKLYVEAIRQCVQNAPRSATA